MPKRSDLLKSARAKRTTGKPLNKAEKQAVASWRKERAEKLRRSHYAECPQKDMRSLSGRQAKQLQDAERQYGVPCSGATVDLYKVVRWFFDRLADDGRRRRGPGPGRPADEDDGLMFSADSTPALEKFRHWKAKRAELEYYELEGRLLSVESMRTWLDRISAAMRNGLEVLEREFGAGARELLAECLEDVQREIEARRLSDDLDGSTSTEAGGS